MTKKKAIELFGPKIPHTVYVACSGGIDSMFALEFLRKGGRDVTAAFFHHGTETSETAYEYFIKPYVEGKLGVKVVTGHIENECPSDKSQEEHWRDERYKFLHGLPGPVVMAHHLDDCVETWLFGALNGTPKTIPYRNGNVIRPFLLARKDFFTSWCLRNKVFWTEDESNKDIKYMRNRIRHKLVPEALKVNPGLHKVVARKVKESGYGEESQ